MCKGELSCFRKNWKIEEICSRQQSSFLFFPVGFVVHRLSICVRTPCIDCARELLRVVVVYTSCHFMPCTIRGIVPYSSTVLPYHTAVGLSSWCVPYGDTGSDFIFLHQNKAQIPPCRFEQVKLDLPAVCAFFLSRSLCEKIFCLLHTSRASILIPRRKITHAFWCSMLVYI